MLRDMLRVRITRRCRVKNLCPFLLVFFRCLFCLVFLDRGVGIRVRVRVWVIT